MKIFHSSTFQNILRSVLILSMTISACGSPDGQLGSRQIELEREIGEQRGMLLIGHKPGLSTLAELDIWDFGKKTLSPLADNLRQDSVFLGADSQRVFLAERGQETKIYGLNLNGEPRLDRGTMLSNTSPLDPQSIVGLGGNIAVAQWQQGLVQMISPSSGQILQTVSAEDVGLGSFHPIDLWTDRSKLVILDRGSASTAPSAASYIHIIPFDGERLNLSSVSKIRLRYNVPQKFMAVDNELFVIGLCFGSATCASGVERIDLSRRQTEDLFNLKLAAYKDLSRLVVGQGRDVFFHARGRMDNVSVIVKLSLDESGTVEEVFQFSPQADRVYALMYDQTSNHLLFGNRDGTQGMMYELDENFSKYNIYPMDITPYDGIWF